MESKLWMCMQYQQLLVITFISTTYAVDHSAAFSTFLKSLKKADSHNGLKNLPQWKNGNPVFVHAGMYIQSITNLRVREMSLDIDMYLKLSWMDERFTNASLFNDQSLIILANNEDVDLFWKPDFQFVSTKTVEFHNVLHKNHGIRLFSTGEVQYSVRISITIYCPMDFHLFPFDRQICRIRIESFNSVLDMVNASWFSSLPIDSAELSLPQMEIVSITPDTCSRTFSYSVMSGVKSATYPCLVAEIQLDRRINSYIMQMYFPTAVVVIISSLTFWMSPTAVPARISLGVTALLILYTAANTFTRNLPEVSYLRAVDIWVGICSLFVLSGLLEFGIVNHLLNGNVAGDKDHLNRAKLLDRISSYLYPSAFLLFNIVYWTYFLTYFK